MCFLCFFSCGQSSRLNGVCLVAVLSNFKRFYFIISFGRVGLRAKADVTRIPASNHRRPGTCAKHRYTHLAEGLQLYSALQRSTSASTALQLYMYILYSIQPSTVVATTINPRTYPLFRVFRRTRVRDGVGVWQRASYS
jgi:hypothetical protein